MKTRFAILGLALTTMVTLVTGCASEDTNANDGEKGGAITNPGSDGSEPGSDGSEAATTESAQTATGRVGSHGMVLVGTVEHAFLSHIPMFGAPHDVQMIAGGSFSMLDGSSTSVLPSSFSNASFTFLPDRMSLDALRLGSLTELKGTIFTGNFEQGGRPIPSRVRFTVSSVVHQHILETSPPSGNTNPTTQAEDLGYILFGSRTNAFVAHRISTSPSFDEVLRVDLQGQDAPSDAELAHGVDVRAVGTSDVINKRVGRATAATTVTIKTAAGSTAPAKTFTMKAASKLSCLVGPDFAEPCAS